MPTRRSYAGGAAVATITADLSPVALAVPISTVTGWPTGSIGPFFVVINQSFSDEEKVLCTSLSGSTLTLQARGADGSSAQQHYNGATISPCITSTDVDEANNHTSSNAGVHGVTGGVVGTTDGQVLSNKSFSDSPAWSDHTNCNHNHSSVVQGGTLAGTSTAFTYATGWSDLGAPYSAGAFVSIAGLTMLRGAALAGGSATFTVATGLPVPADTRQQPYSCQDLTTNTTVTALVSTTGVLSLSSFTVGHAYAFSGDVYL